MKKRTNKDLGFDQVIKQIASFSLSKEGRKKVINSEIIFSEEEYSNRQNKITYILDCFPQANFLPEAFPDISPAIEMLKKNPTHSLPGEEIIKFGEYVLSSTKLLKFLDSSKDENIFPQLRNILSFDILSLGKEIKNTLVSPGIVKETHPALLRIKKRIEENRRKSDNFSSEFIHLKSSKMQSDNPVFKDGRVMFPIKNEYRKSIDGYVHSSSSSGATFFVEPLKMIEYNNNVVMAEEEIQIEIAKILSSLSSKILDLEKDFESLKEIISFIDWYYSFAMWIKQNNCTKVIPSFDSHLIKLIEAKHPLLKEKCVPINVEIDTNVKAVVLTGPNAGGKTVTMKTVALFVMINQICGFLPCKEGSSLGFFKNIYTDIGDDQSIELNLSTFSGHMKQIGYILNKMDKNSLIVLDELGSGTEAQEGAAIARSVLEYCLSKGGLTLITSHHAVLKQFAYSNPEVLSASMEFDETKGLPTFHFISGIPGESHAVDTARKMGIPEEVIVKAEKYLGTEALKISSIIKNLEKKNLEADKKLEEIQNRYRLLQEEVKKNDLFSLRLNQKELILKKGQLRKLDKFVENTRKELENLVGELRVGEITREKTKKMKTFIEKLEKQSQIQHERISEEEEKLEEKNQKNVEVFKPGMSVLCGKYNREGIIVRPSGKDKWVVAIGQIKFTFKSSQLKKASFKKENLKTNVEFHATSPRPKFELDLRGYKMQEAIEAVDIQIESCLVHGVTSFSIIHGYGNGILSEAIHKWLKKQTNVKNYYFALPEDGGQGKTYVEL